VSPPAIASYEDLLAAARDPARPATLALAGVIAGAPARGDPPSACVRGLAAGELRALLDAFFPALAARADAAGAPPAAPSGEFTEFDDLVRLLDEHAAAPSPESRWVARAVATACAGADHLWQDMGLPSRAVLGALMRESFPALSARNHADMKWKKFLFLQLCEREDVRACTAPSCGVCSDRGSCFGPESGTPSWFARAADRSAGGANARREG